MKLLKRVKSRLYREIVVSNLKDKTPVEKALAWIKAYRVTPEGVMPNYTFQRRHMATQEETGYLLSTLYHYGEKELAFEMAKWEASVQGKDGSFAAMDGVPYTFDTAQVIRGFLTVLDDVPELEGNLRRACDYVEGQIDREGVIHTPSYETWSLPGGNMLHEYGNLYILPPMLQAGRKLNEPRYVQAAKRAMDNYRNKADLVEFKSDLAMLSHYFGYMMEALVDLEEVEFAKKGLVQASRIQMTNGAIPAYPGVNWVCSTGLAQLALAWYKLGNHEPANRALDYMEKIQNPSGGFFGGYGEGVNYFPYQEISWAAKFFLDAYLLKIKTDFNEDSVQWFETINENDGRVQAVLSFLGDLKGKKVIDVGCGKGRFLKILKSHFPDGQYYGMDISDEMLKYVPQGIETSTGNMLNIKYPNAYFDCVYSVEAIEHAVNVENAVKEMARILKPNGKIIIIDKNIGKLGALKIKSWEKWFSRNEIVTLLKKYGASANSKFITYNKLTRPDGLFVAWEGVKNA